MRFFGSDDCARIKTSLKQAFTKIKEEFDDHREAINQNTNEIQANYEYLCKLDMKIDKLAERVDELTMFLQHDTEQKYEVSSLTSREKEVFVALYSTNDPLTYKDIARKTGLTDNLAVCYVANLLAKGIPVHKRYVNNEVILVLDTQFREHQMKTNAIGLSETVAKNVVL